MDEKTINILESGRAKFAYECAEKGVKLKEYKSYVKKLPMLIKTNGLASALCFYFANSSTEGKVKIDKAYGLVYRHIEEWLSKDNKQLVTFEQDKLAKNLLELDSYSYRAVTVEVLAFLTWLRRFADGLASDSDKD